MNEIINGITKHTSGLWMVYWVPSILYFFTIMLAFEYGTRLTHIISVSIGFASILWHLFSMILFAMGKTEYPTPYAASEASDLHAILWFVELVPALAILITHIRIVVASGAILKLTPEMID